MTEWENCIKQIERTKYKLYNGQTGRYVCDANGRIKIFDTKEEVVTYIHHNRLSTVYEIKEC